MEKIDFVVTWVDGNDPQWIAEKRKWEKASGIVREDDANADCRYRPDEDMLRYRFRGVEKYAPWVNKVFFVTCGQKPDWLNENHPKLRLVNHEDYIPSEYLPTFNSRVIELNFNRISDLSEHFVLFNDDIFLTQPIKEDYFFKFGNPVLETYLKFRPWNYSNISRIIFNDFCVVNSSFDIGQSIWENRRKWFSVKELGYRRALRNYICYLVDRLLPVGFYGHSALPHLKSTFQELWDRHTDIMDLSSKQRFRADNQVNHWLMCAWNLAKGYFYPCNVTGRCQWYNISTENVDEAASAVRQQSYPQVCMNDSRFNDDSKKCSRIILDAFSKILPEKSSFEKY